MTEKKVEAELPDSEELRRRRQTRNLVIAFAVVEAIAFAVVIIVKMSR